MAKKKKRPRIIRPKFKMFQVGGRCWIWLLQSGNGKVLAQSGDSYKRKRDCRAAIEGLQNMARACEIEVLVDP